MRDEVNNLFSQKQHNLVAFVKDEELRATLLHQLRLRDLVSRDHDLIERRCNTLTDQVIELRKLLEEQEEEK